MLRSFKEIQKNEAAYETRDRGIRSVPLARIVGSVGRYLDFDERFRIRSHVPVERLENIKNRMRSGKVLPPVKLNTMPWTAIIALQQPMHWAMMKSGPR